MALGQIFLNLAFSLYLILYLPQIIHNSRLQKFDQMSLGMHFMILQAYACDLCYGLAKNLPWQYLTVSCIGLFFLCIQHGQWYRFKQKHSSNLSTTFLILGFCSLIWPWLIYVHLPFNWQMLINGWISRIFFIAHFLPQILKNKSRKTRVEVINRHYLMISITLSMVDLSAAYLLNWGNINIIGGMLSLMLKLYLSIQILR
jgi:uncharacterized protein with PQ loop repeat